MNWLYPQVCTCTEDATMIAMLLLYQEASTGMDTARFERFDTCSEAVLAHKLIVKYRSSQQMDLYMISQGQAANLEYYFTRMQKKIAEWNHADGIYDQDDVMTAAQLVKALFFELDISASDEVQQFVVQRIEELAVNYDFEHPRGLYSNQELQALFAQQGTKIWGAMMHYKEIKGDDSLAKRGTYYPNTWVQIVDYADYYGNRNGVISASELVSTIQTFMRYSFARVYTDHWTALLQNVVCPVSPFNSGGRITTDEMKSCMIEHGTDVMMEIQWLLVFLNA